MKALDLQKRFTSLEEGDQQAAAMFERAVELDPDFVEAWAELSQHHASAYTGWDRTEARLSRAKAALDGAERVGADLPKTRWARGYYHYYGFRDYDRALIEFEAAAESAPNDAGIQQSIAYIHRRKGDLDQALHLLERAAELDPQDANIFRNLAGTYRAQRKTEETLAHRDRVLALEPESDGDYSAKADDVRALTGDLAAARAILERSPGNSPLQVAFGSIGQLFEERDYDAIIDRMEALETDVPFVQTAREFILAIARSLRDGPAAAEAELESAAAMTEKLLETAPGNDTFHQWLSAVYAYLDRADAAVREARLAVDLTAKDAFSGPAALENLAATYGWVGRTDEAFELIGRLLASHYESSLTVHQLRLDPRWDPLRDDPRFDQLLAKFG